MKIRQAQRRNIIILIAAFFAIITICSFVTLRNGYAPDFTHFKTSREVEQYLKSHLQVGETSQSQTTALLMKLGVHDCSESIVANGNTKEDNGQVILVCTAKAPGENFAAVDGLHGWLNDIIVQWFYLLKFKFHEDTLVAIEVVKGDVSF